MALIQERQRGAVRLIARADAAREAPRARHNARGAGGLLEGRRHRGGLASPLGVQQPGRLVVHKMTVGRRRRGFSRRGQGRPGRRLLVRLGLRGRRGAVVVLDAGSVQDGDDLGGGRAGREGQLLAHDDLLPQRHREEDAKEGERGTPGQHLRRAEPDAAAGRVLLGCQLLQRGNDAHKAGGQRHRRRGDRGGLHDHVLRGAEARRPAAPAQQAEEAEAQQRGLQAAHRHPPRLQAKVHVGAAQDGAHAEPSDDRAHGDGGLHAGRWVRGCWGCRLRQTAGPAAFVHGGL
mmetsp:Transcript_14829/g.38456  ORF Transcript_14829/g.38456 Transcript_14829/m.38456 type:complete len:290 (+) Transcript_14829:437-1306(+)